FLLNLYLLRNALLFFQQDFDLCGFTLAQKKIVESWIEIWSRDAETVLARGQSVEHETTVRSRSLAGNGRAFSPQYLNRRARNSRTAAVVNGPAHDGLRHTERPHQQKDRCCDQPHRARIPERQPVARIVRRLGLLGGYRRLRILIRPLVFAF